MKLSFFLLALTVWGLLSRHKKRDDEEDEDTHTQSGCGILNNTSNIDKVNFHYNNNYYFILQHSMH